VEKYEEKEKQKVKEPDRERLQKFVANFDLLPILTISIPLDPFPPHHPRPNPHTTHTTG
jgi:hypothetical protein